jgi:hypothetical protein
MMLFGRKVFSKDASKEGVFETVTVIFDRG